jgi:hypothetical protein
MFVRLPVSRYRAPVARCLLGVMFVAGLGSGCRLAQEAARAPVQAFTAVVPGGAPTAPDPATLQTELQRFADEYASRSTAALDEYAARTGTPAGRHQALAWKVAVGFAAVGIASGPNPRANLVDFLSLSSLTRLALEEIASTGSSGPALQPWLHVSRSLETNAWSLADEVFAPEQVTELRESIRRWWEQHPDARTSLFARPQEFSSLLRRTRAESARPGSIFTLVGLDPTAGLDPAVREVTRTRLFAERAMFTVQRLPFLLRWQTELLADEMLRQDELATAVASADRLSRAAESASQTAAQLPDRITAEREAILAAFQTQEGKLRDLAVEVGRTLTAGQQMSTSLNTTLITFDALMKRFGVGEPDTGPPDTNSPPFNILDYARTAEQISAMAQQLDALLRDTDRTLDSPALDKRLRELNALSTQARDDAKSVLNHAFLLAAGLVGLIFVGLWLYRRSGRGHS